MPRLAAVAATIGALGAIGTVGAGSARADFTETFCSGGAPAAPWTEGLGGDFGFLATDDECASGGYGFVIEDNPMDGDRSDGAGIQAPAGETFTGVTVSFLTLPSSGAEANLTIGHDGQSLGTAAMGSPAANTTLSSTLADAHTVTVNVTCTTAGGTNCPFANNEPLTVGRLALTIHDTGLPSVNATGGTLLAAGARSGEQSITYAAQDGGSGVQRVTASLAGSVVGSSTSQCQTSSLQPCPASSTGAIAVNTATVPDGTYPLILTAYDVSGDPASVDAGSVFIDNHLPPTTVIPKRRRGHVRVRVIAYWRWHPRTTQLRSLSLKGMPRRASVTLTCTGRACPRRRWSAKPGHSAALRRALARRWFHAGDRLTLTIAERHERAERVRFTIRAGKKPELRLL